LEALCLFNRIGISSGSSTTNAHHFNLTGNAMPSSPPIFECQQLHHNTGEAGYGYECDVNAECCIAITKHPEVNDGDHRCRCCTEPTSKTKEAVYEIEKEPCFRVRMASEDSVERLSPCNHTCD
uniref:CTCK domain-containing protein n=1 Tax=Haemonchus placei TaxID=6290 RepID=A0A0N4VSA1_HAEPC